MEECAIRDTIELLGGRYKLLIIRALLYAGAPMRFGALKTEVPNVSQKTLTRNLRELAEFGILTRTAYAEVPPRVEYELTKAGTDLMPVFRSMDVWGTRHLRT